MALVVEGTSLAEEALLGGIGGVTSASGVVEGLLGAVELEVCVGAVEVGQVLFLRGLCGFYGGGVPIIS